jgi:hypothetical protein
VLRGEARAMRTAYYIMAIGAAIVVTYVLLHSLGVF